MTHAEIMELVKELNATAAEVLTEEKAMAEAFAEQQEQEA